MAVFNHDINANKTDEWATPRTLTRSLAGAVGGFDLDPASGAEKEPHAETTFDKGVDGLKQPWHGKVFCNPPFSDKVKWLEKAISEVDSGRAKIVVMVLPVDTSTKWYHKYVTQSSAVCFMGPGRVDFEQTEFGGRRNSPNFATMLVVFGDVSPPLLQVLNSRGVVYWNQQLYEEFKQVSLGEMSTDGGRDDLFGDIP